MKRDEFFFKFQITISKNTSTNEISDQNLVQESFSSFQPRGGSIYPTERFSTRGESDV